LIAVSVYLVLTGIGYYLESKAYNEGVCPDCGGKLRFFDTDSQNGRGYMCEKCYYTTWVSYSNIDK
jgi:predicted RNA-binding Zn-ribbon protein involved in translation (DUF1610 family)